MTPFRRTWVTSDPDDEDNAVFVPEEEPSLTPPQDDGQTKLDDFADRLSDSFEPVTSDPPQSIIDIDRLMAEKQGLRQGTLDPYADPGSVVAKRQAELKPFIDQYAKYRDIASMWGLNMNGYRFPRDLPDEEIQAFLDRMYGDLQQRIARKKRYGW